MIGDQRASGLVQMLLCLHIERLSLVKIKLTSGLAKKGVIEMSTEQGAIGTSDSIDSEEIQAWIQDLEVPEGDEEIEDGTEVLMSTVEDTRAPEEAYATYSVISLLPAPLTPPSPPAPPAPSSTSKISFASSFLLSPDPA